MADQPAGTELLIVVDQFEEVFTLCASGERTRFIAALLAAAQSPEVRAGVVLGVRADFYGRCAEHPDLVEALHDARRGYTLSLTAYEASGGIEHALARTAESVYSGLTSEQRRLARGIFLRLVALGDGTEDTKRRVAREEFGDGTESVLDALARARL